MKGNKNKSHTIDNTEVNCCIFEDSNSPSFEDVNLMVFNKTSRSSSLKIEIHKKSKLGSERSGD